MGPPAVVRGFERLVDPMQREAVGDEFLRAQLATGEQVEHRQLLRG